MRVWLVCFILLLGSAELFHWVQRFSLPLPIFILGGAFLAIASNYDKLTDLPFHPDHDTLPPDPPSKPSVAPASQAAVPLSRSDVHRPSLDPRPTAISFEIKKPFQAKD
jgi:hypothetical protein